jgi:methionine synthase II (cobalamin-independent)
MERAGIDIITDGEIRRESYSNRFATAFSGVDLDKPATVRGRTGGRVSCRAAPARSAGFSVVRRNRRDQR